MSTEPSRINRTIGQLGGKYGLLLIGAGLLTVGLAWNGAAGVIVVAAQMPYVITGLGLGLTLAMFGSALMVIQAHREDRARLEQKLDEVIDAIGRGRIGLTDEAPRDLAGLVVAGSASYHVPGCRLVDGREEVSYLTPEEARARFLAPCRVCQPESSNVTTL